MPHHHAEHRVGASTIVVHRESEGDPATLEIHGPVPLAELDADGLGKLINMLESAWRPDPSTLAAMLTDATTRPDLSNGR